MISDLAKFNEEFTRYAEGVEQLRQKPAKAEKIQLVVRHYDTLVKESKIFAQTTREFREWRGCPIDSNTDKAAFILTLFGKPEEGENGKSK